MPNDIHSRTQTDRQPGGGRGGFTEAGARGFGRPLTAGERLALGAFDDAAIVAPPADDLKLAREFKNDLGNGRRLRARHGETLRWCDEVGGWVAWDGRRWSIDDGDALALIRAHETSEAVLDERGAVEEAGKGRDETEEEYEERIKRLGAWAVSTGNTQRVKGMLSAAAPYLRARLDTFDADPWALNVANGILRLDTPREPGAPAPLFPHDPGQRLSKISPVAYDPDAECPRWRAFVADVFEGRPEVAEYVQTMLGYCLSGDTSQQQMWMLEGKGANGKSTLLEVVARVMGEHSAVTPIETFLHREHKSGSGPSPDIARLPGVRFLRGSEPEPGARLSESTIKQVTGGEPLAARHLNEGFFEFRPCCKLVLSVNVRPVLVGKDHGIRSRIVVVPFARQFERGAAKRGRTLVDELMGEAPGILNWLLEGLSMWWDVGLVPPDPVKAATKAYFDEMDPIGSFVAECCERPPACRPEDSEGATDLFKAYETWCRANNETPREQTAFGRRLNDLGHGTKRIGGYTQRMGIKLKGEYRPQAGGLGEGE